MEESKPRVWRRKNDALEGSGPPVLGGRDISPQLPGLGFGAIRHMPEVACRETGVRVRNFQENYKLKISQK